MGAKESRIGFLGYDEALRRGEEGGERGKGGVEVGGDSREGGPGSRCPLVRRHLHDGPRAEALAPFGGSFTTLLSTSSFIYLSILSIYLFIYLFPPSLRRPRQGPVPGAASPPLLSSVGPALGRVWPCGCAWINQAKLCCHPGVTGLSHSSRLLDSCLLPPRAFPRMGKRWMWLPWLHVAVFSPVFRVLPEDLKREKYKQA